MAKTRMALISADEQQPGHKEAGRQLRDCLTVKADARRRTLVVAHYGHDVTFCDVKNSRFRFPCAVEFDFIKNVRKR